MCPIWWFEPISAVLALNYFISTGKPEDLIHCPVYRRKKPDPSHWSELNCLTEGETCEFVASPRIMISLLAKCGQ